MPFTQGFWARINDLLGIGKQKLVMDGEWANSLKAFVTRTLPFQKCLVKQVSLAVSLDPDILGSHCLPFYLTYTTREVPRWRWSSQRGALCRAKLGTRKWRAPPTLLQRPGLCPWRSIYFMIHQWKGSGVDNLYAFEGSLVVSICVQGGKKERCWSPLWGIRKEQTGENPDSSSTEGSHSGENHWHQNHQRGTKVLSLFLLFSPSLAKETVRTACCPCHLLSAFEQVMSSLWTSIFLSVKWRSWPAVQVFKNVPWDPWEPPGEDQGWPQ